MDDHYNTIYVIIIPCCLALPYVDLEDCFAVSPETMISRHQDWRLQSCRGIDKDSHVNGWGASEVDIARLRKIV